MKTIPWGACILASIALLVACVACGPEAGNDGGGSQTPEEAACTMVCAHLGCDAGSVDEEAIEACEAGCSDRTDDASEIGPSCAESYLSLGQCIGDLDCEMYTNIMQNNACDAKSTAFEMACPGLTFYFGG